MKYLLVTLNLFAAFLVLPAAKGVNVLYTLSTQSVLTELNRVGAIESDKLAQVHPEYIQEGHVYFPLHSYDKRLHTLWIAIPCIIGFILNALLIGLFWPRHQAEQGAAANP